MAANPFLRANTYRFTPPKPMADYPKESIKKIAVLFTDIVGSSNFFKTYGDIAGRKMLKLHQDMASPLIIEFGGTPVKVLGDSIMAYYLNPAEAVKSAIKIQQSFQRHNKEKEAKDRIHIRICIHYGEGIVEEKDIFGDVVNMAAKILPLVDGDQIFVSQEVQMNAQDLPSINFEQIKVSRKKQFFDKLTVFKVIWHEALSPAPNRNTLLYIKPVWSLGNSLFPEVWRDLTKNRRNMYLENSVIKEEILDDRSLVLILNQISSSFDLAKNLMKHLRLNMGQDGTNLLPVQIVIDSGPYLTPDRISLNNLKIEWNQIEPGGIYISNRVKEGYQGDRKFTCLPSTAADPNSRFFKIVFDDEDANRSNLFMYQKSMIQGDYSPCFYCGDQRHRTAKCPSKQITELTQFIEKLGYIPIDGINQLFFQYLNKQNSVNTELSGARTWLQGDDPVHWAQNAFFELKGVCQLRFLRTIWSSSQENWNRIKESGDGNDKGGLLWIGLDCIRVSNYSQAESILENALSNNPNDYKVFCVAGFLHIEKNNMQGAIKHFRKALDYAKTTPQQILILFLLARAYHLMDDHLKAKKMITKIIRLNPYCHEAVYQDIKYRLQFENRASSLNQLVKLIKNNRDYYIISLIDPDLSSFGEDIQHKLERLVLKAKEEASVVLPEMETELERLEGLMGNDAKEVSEAHAMASKIKELSTKESYFGFLDIIHYGGSIINMTSRIVEGRTTRLNKKIRAIRHRLFQCSKTVQGLPYAFLSGPVSHEVELLRKRADLAEDGIESYKPDEYADLLKTLDGIFGGLDRIENRVKRLLNMSQWLGFCAGFFKKSIIFQSANLVIGLILLPIMTHYLNFIFPEYRISPQSAWYYQKIFITLGAITGVIISSITTKISLSK